MYALSKKQTTLMGLVKDAGRILLKSNAQIKLTIVNKNNKTSIDSIRGIKSLMDTTMSTPLFLFM